ncbi:hypothetical protein FNV43_RR13230 [Rhamnella rubrinervis]|uniref:ARM repeat N-terminal plant domain-containing protein n=1 Tax=Rhamnella rubrinervis TaxID=2594499 RepID=A0A8K0H0R5_9ROSA|nr:hypothetical protein FNV43_RR13230 [Rhamnella rubrinervis]
MKEPDSHQKRARIANCFKKIPLGDQQDHVLVLSGLWNIAMTHPDNPEFPSLGVFECMASLIDRGINDRNWLYRDQNVYIPYYAAHIIGSYTMNKVEFAEKAVKAGVIPPLMELLRGKMSWIEQRVAVRALGHLASYDATLEALASYEHDFNNLLTKGVGGLEMEKCKAEEWSSQLQCCGLVNYTSPAGVGLIRILCYSKYGRKMVSESIEVLENLGNLSRSSDDWQYIGIDCLLLLLKDPDTSNRAQCQLLLKDPDSAISDSTRALCLSTPVNSHCRSLWRRSQAYDMKVGGHQACQDSILCSTYDQQTDRSHVAILPAQSKMESGGVKEAMQESRGDHESGNEGMMRYMMENKGLSTITEEPLIGNEWSRRKLERARRISKRAVMAPSINLLGLPHHRAEIPCGGSDFDGKC